MSKEFPKKGKILLRLPNWIGDAVMASPVLATLSHYFDGIALIGRPHVLGLFAACPKLEKAYPLLPGNKRLFSLAKELKGRYEAGILLPNSLSSALLFFLARLKARAGYNTDARRLFLTHAVKKPEKPVHQRDYYLHLLEKLGFEIKERDYRLFLPEKAKERARLFLSNLPRPWVGLAPGAAFGPAKKWPVSRYRALAFHLRRLGFSVLVLGSKEEAPAGEEITKDLPRSRNLCGLLDLATSSAVISLLDLFVSNDSGLMHVAAALKVPQVAIFGSTSPEASGPINPKAQVVSANVSCSPCFSRTCKRGYECFEKIQVSQVLQACQEVVS